MYWDILPGHSQHHQQVFPLRECYVHCVLDMSSIQSNIAHVCIADQAEKLNSTHFILFTQLGKLGESSEGGLDK
jgi:hypothetical protein